MIGKTISPSYITSIDAVPVRAGKAVPKKKAKSMPKAKRKSNARKKK